MHTLEPFDFGNLIQNRRLYLKSIHSWDIWHLRGIAQDADYLKSLMRPLQSGYEIDGSCQCQIDHQDVDFQIELPD